jgi:hypothetical protein
MEMMRSIYQRLSLHARVDLSVSEILRSLLSAVLREAGITRDGAAEMLLAAGNGTLHTGDCAEQPYRSRLTTMVDMLIAGFTSDAKG